MMDQAPITELRNLGPQSSQWLRAAGINTLADLQQLGPVAAYRLVKQQQPAASLNLLWGLAAGLQGLDWRKLTPDIKQQLQQELATL